MAGWLETYRGTVYPWHCDHMGHMNVMWYVGKFDEATWQFNAALGLPASRLRAEDRGTAAVQQKIAYRRELHAGDVVAVRTGLLSLSGKVFRFVSEMRNATSGEVAAIAEMTGVYLDTVARKAVPFPDDVVARSTEFVIDYDTAGLFT